METIQELISKEITKQVGGNVLFPNDTMGKWINGEFIIKSCCGRKNFSHDWIENVKKEDIDDRYYNLDGSRKK